MDEGEREKASAMLPRPEAGVWGRNPFLTQEEIASLQKKEPPPPIPETVAPPVWEVKSILISGSSRVATINDSIVTVGDFVGEERVLEIQEDRVVLGREGKKWVIRVKQPAIPIEMEEERSER